MPGASAGEPLLLLLPLCRVRPTSAAAAAAALQPLLLLLLQHCLLLHRCPTRQQHLLLLWLLLHLLGGLLLLPQLVLVWGQHEGLQGRAWGTAFRLYTPEMQPDAASKWPNRQSSQAGWFSGHSYWQQTHSAAQQ